MIKAIIFDYFGVLTTDRYMTWLQRNPAVALEHAAAIEALCKAQDTGLSDAEFFARLAEIAGQPEADVRGEFQIHGVAHQGLVQYIRHLRRRGLKTAILSNSSIGLYAQTTEHHLAPVFDVILCSEEAGVAKPEPEIYRILLKRLEMAPAESLFVDDRSYNVRGAEAVGMTGIIYDGLAKLRDELIRRGIDAPEK